MRNNFKLDELNVFIIMHDVKIIGIAESWLNETVDNSEVAIENFTLYRRDRQDIKVGRGGGVLLYVHNSIIFCACTELTSFKNESVWCKISTSIAKDSDELYIGVVYRSPNADVSEVNELFSVIKYVSSKQVMIMGDFNYPGIDWECLDSDSEGESFLSVVQDCFLFQHVLTPTREINVFKS